MRKKYYIFQNSYSWSATYGLTIYGSCELTCTNVTLSLTGDQNTYGVTCFSTLYGNQLKPSSDGTGNK